MSKVFNMVGGGGGKNISSIIITGRESTDTITCTKDGKSYTATWDSTDQHWEIVGLPLGAFTVTATNGTKTSTETVLIDIAGVYEIEMFFKLWLYREGDECKDISGGWDFGISQEHKNYGSSSSNKENNCLKISIKSITAGFLAGFVTTNKIDLSGYSALKVEHTFEPDTSGTNTFVVIHPTPIKIGDSGYNMFESPYTDVSAISTEPYISSVDISTIAESKYIAISGYVQASSGFTLNSRISKVWLE